MDKQTIKKMLMEIDNKAQENDEYNEYGLPLYLLENTFIEIVEKYLGKEYECKDRFQVNNVLYSANTTLAKLFWILGSTGDVDEVVIKKLSYKTFVDLENDLVSERFSFTDIYTLIKAYMSSDQKLEAIKVAHKATGWELKDAKEFVENNF